MSRYLHGYKQALYNTKNVSTPDFSDAKREDVTTEKM